MSELLGIWTLVLPMQGKKEISASFFTNATVEEADKTDRGKERVRKVTAKILLITGEREKYVSASLVSQITGFLKALLH